MKAKPGEKVRITGYPPRKAFGWMAALVGEEGEVVETGERGIVRVSVPAAFDGEPHWLGLAYVEKVEGRGQAA